MKTPPYALSSSSSGRSLVSFPALAAISLMLLTACNDAAPAQGVPVVRANQCVKDWLRQAEVPGCALDYLDLIAKQQAALEKTSAE